MVNITTALFDISRNTNGDGRSMDQYLDWLNSTLKVDSRMTIYTEPKFFDFINSRRREDNTTIVCYELEDIPYYYLLPKMNKILSDSNYREKIKDPNRIECNLSLYNIIQYSKFKWISNTIELDGGESDFYFWMDAGCSRFFNATSIKNWPDESRLVKNKLNIQGNINTEKMYPTLDPEVYKWENNCILVGTLFGGDRDTMKVIGSEVENILINDMIFENMVNNEQIALGMLLKRNPDLFSVYIKLNSGHLPLFEYLSNPKL